MQLRVLVACECSGRVRDAFAARGWEAWSADLLGCEVSSRLLLSARSGTKQEDRPGIGNHYQGDCRDLFERAHPVNRARSAEMTAGDPWLWHLIIAHPPCDHLSYAGARWFKTKQADGRQPAAAKFFMQMVNSPGELICVENPHSVMQRLYQPPTQIVQPWWFGDPFVKGTHLWLKGLPPLVATHTEKQYPGLFRATTGGGSWRTDKTRNRARMILHEDSEGRENRARVRSRTFYGLAQAMAVQWGQFAEEYYAGHQEAD